MLVFFRRRCPEASAHGSSHAQRLITVPTLSDHEPRTARSAFAKGLAVDIVPQYFLYGEADRAVDRAFIHVESISVRSRRHDWHIAPHRHATLFQLLLLSEGTAELRMDAEGQHLQAPSIVTVPPGVIHAFQFVPGAEGWVIMLAEDYAAELLKGEGGSEWLSTLTTPTALLLDPDAAAAHSLDERCSDIEREFRWSALGRTAAISAHLRLLFVAVARLRHQRSLPAVAVSESADLYARFRSLVEAHFREHRPIADYAKTLCITEKRLAVACREAVGHSPLESIHRRLALEAQRSLLYTSLSITQVAYALGFADPAYFSRFFTRQVGMAPRDFIEHQGRMETKLS